MSPKFNFLGNLLLQKLMKFALQSTFGRKGKQEEDSRKQCIGCKNNYNLLSPLQRQLTDTMVSTRRADEQTNKDILPTKPGYVTLILFRMGSFSV